MANIPLIIRGGEKGKVITEPASHIDLTPTIMDYMGLPVPKLLEGKVCCHRYEIMKKKLMMKYILNLHVTRRS